ncbi:MAG: hypothetical protein E7400_01730 [Ruminococcaceae bacterium]|nr:hypothetical protein [Oscillospiraceae bacterium]
MVNTNSVLSSIFFSQTIDWNIKQFFNSNTIQSSFDLKRIGKAITRCKDQMIVEDGNKYKRITIKTNCGGVVVRDEVLGEEIKTKNQYYIKAGQLAVSKIDARNGAFGIVPPEADGAIITGNFWVYDVNPEVANIEYLVLLLSSNAFVQAWQDCSNGSGNRLYLQEDKFLNYKIPMPLVEEQERIVYKYNKGVNSANEAISEADKLSNSIDSCLSSLLQLKTVKNQHNDKSGLISTTTLKNLIGWGAKTNSNPIKPQELFESIQYENMPLEFYCEINPKTIYPDQCEEISFVPMECVSDIYGEIAERKNGKISNSKGYTLFQENDVIWAKITPCMQNGKCAIATNLKNGYAYGSTEFHVLRANENALPEYIHCFMRSKRLREVAMSYFTGSAGQQRVGTDFLSALTLPLLPLRSDDRNVLTQETIVKKVAGIRNQIKELHLNAEKARIQARKDFEEVIFGE